MLKEPFPQLLLPLLPVALKPMLFKSAVMSPCLKLMRAAFRVCLTQAEWDKS
jgi:hypothetical protein